MISMEEFLKVRKPKFTKPELLYTGGLPAQIWGINPRTIMSNKAWSKIRKKTMEKNNNCCWVCGVDVADVKRGLTLEVHEIYKYSWKKETYPEEVLVELDSVCALCRICHEVVHIGRVQWLVETGKRPFKYLTDTQNHGEKILRKAKKDGTWKILPIPYHLRMLDVPEDRWYLKVGRKTKSIPEWRSLI